MTWVGGLKHYDSDKQRVTYRREVIYSFTTSRHATQPHCIYFFPIHFARVPKQDSIHHRFKSAFLRWWSTVQTSGTFRRHASEDRFISRLTPRILAPRNLDRWHFSISIVPVTCLLSILDESLVLCCQEVSICNPLPYLIIKSFHAVHVFVP